MILARLDHIVLAASNLEAGSAYLANALGVSLEAGGAHPAMGTHNRLLKLAQDQYLELIAIDSAAAEPSRPRWFGLDGLHGNAPVRLVAWVMRVSDLQQLGEAAFPFPGHVEAMSRGALCWSITIPADGSVPLDGVAPMLIQWETGQRHPTETLPDRGCKLLRLEGFHPEALRLNAWLRSMTFEGPFDAALPRAGRDIGLIATLQTPGGLRRLTASGVDLG